VPKLLRLVSLEVLDLQEGDDYYQRDLLRFIVILDGHPVRRMGWTLGREVYEFTDDDNLTDEEWTGETTPFVYWSFADITVFEIDPEGASFGVEGNTDEWIQTVRLDHRDENPIEVGRESTLSYLAPGRSDCRYLLTYAIRNHDVEPDDRLFDRLNDTSHESEFLRAAETTGDFEADKGDCKWICAIDGGGLRGIFPLRVLEQMEHYYGRSCLEMFDMFAGTSTGSMIAGALASGRPLREVIALYADETTRRQIFRENSRGQHHAFRYLDLKRMGEEGRRAPHLDNAMYLENLSDKIESWRGPLNRMINAAARQIMTPRYRKTGMKEVLYQLLSARRGSQLVPLSLRDCYRDILITARDLNRNETTLFSAFHIPYTTSRPADSPTRRSRSRGGSSRPGDRGRTRLPRDLLATAFAANTGIEDEQEYQGEIIDVVTGLYQDVLLKDAVEASSSAPVYFAPRGRFTDGGVGPYNNPSFIGAFEALNNSHVDVSQDALPLQRKYTPYSEAGGTRSGTVVWSLGTAYPYAEPEQEADTANLVSGSLSLNERTDTVLYLANEVIDNLMFGASQEQVFLCREYLRDQIKFLRINLGLNRSTLFELNVPGDRDETLSSIKLDAFAQVDFDRMDEVAKRFALAARDRDFGFNQTGFELPDPALDVVSQQTYASYVQIELQEFE
jgi:patatin-like phospholipase/acyl hydrolase